MRKTTLTVLVILIFGSISSVPGAEQPPADIARLIAQLGDESFIVRERAEAQLLRVGPEAFAELKIATQNDDVEIAQRAQQILSQIEQSDRGNESDSVRSMIGLYMQENNIAQKTRYLWIIAGLPDCEGLRTLCRIARFDQEYTLRVESAKCLIASPPTAYSMRKKWFQTLKTVFSGDKNDEILRLVYDHASLRTEIIELREAAETKSRENEKATGKPTAFPVPIIATEELKNRILIFTDDLASFQSKPENNAVQPGHRFDILLFFALAELQDAAGMNTELNRTLDAALAIRTENMRSENPLLLIDPLEESMFSDHYYVGQYLELSYRYRWAERHFKLVADEAPLRIKINANHQIFGIKRILAEYKGAIEPLDKIIEMLKSEEYKSKMNDSDTRVPKFVAGKEYCLAMIAAAEEKWAEAKKHADSSFEKYREDIDVLILQYEIGKHTDIADDKYRADIKHSITMELARIENNFQARNPNFDTASACNQAAWLLANTDGDFETVLPLIKTTIKAEPESPTYLDTMGHVYALGKDYGKAIEVQEQAVRFAPEATVMQNALKRFRELAANAKNNSIKN